MSTTIEIIFVLALVVGVIVLVCLEYRQRSKIYSKGVEDLWKSLRCMDEERLTMTLNSDEKPEEIIYDVESIVRGVIKGRFDGCSPNERKQILETCGYKYKNVQELVNEEMSKWTK